MTREIIEDFRFIVIPYMVNRLKEINYEGQGGSDAEEFMSDFNEICDLAIKALEQEPILDKIRAEIKTLPIAFTSSFDMKQDCLEILDKYKGESEG